ncbi:hypothetical protein HIM_09613 [Hirsutella minnesotensis 3608]|uniref:Uncharacterized protein n=1 Tax=Hirsutella minnesotensis 3608 TaxID=1043627 RepID=A0A0F7ZXM9_9HYPO|nr:hypothetical protein HIM_09613 [Hirsutella minnesotensis 3608]
MDEHAGEERGRDDRASRDVESLVAWTSNSLETDARPNDPAVDALLRFCYFMITEDFGAGSASSTMLVYFSGVRGLSWPDGREYLRPYRFTPILARFIYCTRLIFLEAVLPRFLHGRISTVHRARHGLLKTLNILRRRYMCDGTLSPMGEFLSLLAYGSALRRSQGPTFHFHWSDDGEVLSWDGTQQLSMNNFRALARNVLDSATSCSARLMYDWEPAYPNLGGIHDRMSNTTPGYSFVQDPDNNLKDAYLDLLLRACVSPVDGLLHTGTHGQGTWDVRAAQAYLDAHDDFLRMLMVLCNLDGGQCARITELSTLEHCNTPSRSRGIYIWGAKICSVTRHHKSRRRTNREFYVARFFSFPVSMLIFQYLVYIRPTVYAILRKCFHRERKDALLFLPLSRGAELRRHCSATPGIPAGLGAQLYRQVSVAITERHVSTVAVPFDRFDDATAAAGDGVAFAWQSGHRPFERHTTYGLDGAFPDQLQPALLQVYAKVSKSWHDFLWRRGTDLRCVDDGAEIDDAADATIHPESLSRKRPYPMSPSSQQLPSKIAKISSGTITDPVDTGVITRLGYSTLLAAGAGEEADGIGDEEPAAQADIPTPSAINRAPPYLVQQAQPAAADVLSDAPLTISPFVYSSQLNLVVCIDCKVAIVAMEAKGHLNHLRHRRIFAPSQRNDILDRILSIPDIIKDQAELQQRVPPLPSTNPIPYIKPPMHDGLGCNQCPYVVRDIRRMQEHCRTEHSWVNDWKKGGDVARRAREQRESRPWRTGVSCQRLCNWGYGNRWFEVSRPEGII